MSENKRSLEFQGEQVSAPKIADPTGDHGPYCHRESPTGLVCTLMPGHARYQPHVAGNGVHVVAVWFDKGVPGV